jgi:hypothetical protein
LYQAKWSDVIKVVVVRFYATFMQNFVHGIDVLSAGIKAGISSLMNLAGQATDPNNGVYFVNFNQDFT